MPRLNIVNVSKSFGDRKIIDGISFKTEDGELVVILGPSGCGKSTLLRLITGLEDPDEGEIYIGSNRVDRLPPRKRNVALVFQNYALYPHMTVEQNLAFPLKVAGAPKKDIKKRVRDVAAMIGMDDRLEARPSQLSGGQRQRVALGRAIVRQPDMYLLDEPLSNLDAELRTRMRREIVQLQRSLGTTTIHVTHDQTEALSMADRLVVMNEGKIRQIGTVHEVYNRPADMFVASFVGTPKINMIDAEVREGLIKPFDISEVFIPDKYRLREIVIGIRPEHIIADPNGKFGGEVEIVEYLGNRNILTVKFLDQTLLVQTDISGFKAGDRIRFSIDDRDVILFDKETGIGLYQ